MHCQVVFHGAGLKNERTTSYEIWNALFFKFSNFSKTSKVKISMQKSYRDRVRYCEIGQATCR